MPDPRAIERLAGAVRKHGERQLRFHAKEPQLAVVRRLTPLQVELVSANLVLDDEDLTLTQSVRRYESNYGLKVGDTVVVQPVSSGEWVVSSVVSDKSTFQGADTTAAMSPGTIPADTPIVGTVPFRDANGNVVGRIPLLEP